MPRPIVSRMAALPRLEVRMMMAFLKLRGGREGGGSVYAREKFHTAWLPQ